jgi:hypothetical protein
MTTEELRELMHSATAPGPNDFLQTADTMSSCCYKPMADLKGSRGICTGCGEHSITESAYEDMAHRAWFNSEY